MRSEYRKLSVHVWLPIENSDSNVRVLETHLVGISHRSRGLEEELFSVHFL